MYVRFTILGIVLAAWAIGSFAVGRGVPRKTSQKPPPKTTFDKHIRPFLKQYCIKCHGGRRPKADLNLEKFKNQAEAVKHKDTWEKAAEMLQAGEMPPEGKPQPKLQAIERMLDWIDKEVNKLDCTKRIDPGRVTIRRLNRAEYNNTIRDLIGLDLHPADGFPDDDIGHGFDNIGDVLSLSPLHLEKYLKASEKIVGAAFAKADARYKILTRSIRGKNKKENARHIIADFARRAYRRPVDNSEVDRLMRFVTLAQKKGDSFEDGVKLAVQAVLVSPHFLFRIEQDRPIPKGQPGYPISEHELACRLSYFLWSSMPDEELFGLAERKQLRRSLDKQIQRLMRDKKANALVENFAGQWLQLRNLKNHKPDPDSFPDFDAELRLAMVKETELFFAAVMNEDRSIYDFLDADFTFLNERLAKHYGLSGVKGSNFRRMSLKNHTRGGVLTQASILTLTSNPTRTSPVLRGKWILENILASPPPPPPPNVGELDESKQAMSAASLRERMELHRNKPLCASCHKRMDPLGFGLENFDGIGGWREKDGKFAIDASGELPSGEKFTGPRSLRKMLVKSKAKEFRRCLVEKMLTYALGRGLHYNDRCATDKIYRYMDKNGNRFSSMVQAIVKSDPFQMRGGKKLK